MFAGSIPGKTQTMPIAIFFAAEAGKMGEALTWVLMMVAIALVAITAINYWSDSQNLSRSWSVGYGSLIISRWSSIISRWLPTRRKTTNNTPLPRRRSHQQTTNNEGLFVELQKDFSSFTLEANFTANGKPLGILGASGSGKSMTLRCIAGLETPTRGRIVLNGQVLFDSQQGINLPSHQRRIGFVFQNYARFPHMKVAHNLGFGLQELPKAERKRRVYQYIELMQLQGLEKRYPHQLSGGQQQRVALARAGLLVRSPGL